MKLFLSAIWKIFYRTAWAPFLVVFAHNWLRAQIGHRKEYDPYFHMAGGVALAYFFYTAIVVGKPWFGEPKRFVRSVIAICMTMTAAVWWEFMEYYGGRRNTSLNIGDAASHLADTMDDLWQDWRGALYFLLITGLIRMLIRYIKKKCSAS